MTVSTTAHDSDKSLDALCIRNEMTTDGGVEGHAPTNTRRMIPPKAKARGVNPKEGMPSVPVCCGMVYSLGLTRSRYRVRPVHPNTPGLALTGRSIAANKARISAGLPRQYVVTRQAGETVNEFLPRALTPLGARSPSRVQSGAGSFIRRFHSSIFFRSYRKVEERNISELSTCS